MSAVNGKHPGTRTWAQTHRAASPDREARGSSTVSGHRKGLLRRGEGLESRHECCFRSLPPTLCQLLLQPALQCAVGIDAPFQLCPQSLDLSQEVMQVTESALPLPAFSRHLCSGLCGHVQREALASSSARSSRQRSSAVLNPPPPSPSPS